jgi:glycosyltransferase involved in cell wall biosynthesis
VLVPSKSILSELRQHGLKRLEYLPHGVDTQAFNRSYRSIKWRKGYGIDNKIVLLYVGRLVWEKDLEVLADTYAKFESNRSLSFVIVGDGPIRQDLEKLMPKAIFTGKLIGKELSTAYASSDIFVFPSTTETFGNVILEAMISGLPCVAANKGGSKSAIKNNVTGLLAKPHDCKDFTKKVKYLIHHPKLRKQMAQHAVEYAEKQSWNLICERLFKEYYKLLNKNYTRR